MGSADFAFGTCYGVLLCCGTGPSVLLCVLRGQVCYAGIAANPCSTT